MLRRTPCIGTCSTTYGDLVCRGCKRFAHEIVQWNGFDQDQRRVVWQRLLELRAGAVVGVLEVVDEKCLREAAAKLGISGGDQLDAANVVYEALQRLQWREGQWTMETLGVRVRQAGADDPATLLALIDREFYQRSLAQYERNYRIPAQ